jgi:hypothetical protein
LEDDTVEAWMRKDCRAEQLDEQQFTNKIPEKNLLLSALANFIIESKKEVHTLKKISFGSSFLQKKSPWGNSTPNPQLCTAHTM